MMAEPIDPLAKAQAAALAGLSNVRPIRSDLASGDVVKCVTAAQFLADVDEPVWLVDGLVQLGYLYALTAPTNHGKTAVSLVMAMCIAAGIPFADLPTVRGRVLLLCGENQDGFRLRMLATLDSLGLTPASIVGYCWVYPQSGALEKILPGLKEDVVKLGMGDLAFVLVDTSVAYFSGQDENDNVAALWHALALRELTRLPGTPSVMANCHPTGSATKEGCVPRGGSAFLNEIDTNLTVWADGDTSELHWTRKKRGPDFEPLWFEYCGKTLRQFGRNVPTVVAQHISEDRDVAIRKARREDENRVLYELNANPGGTFSEWAQCCGFISSKGTPLKSKVFRLLERLKEVKLVANDRRKGWHLTKAGEEEARSIR
jgi:hypothetical protein